MTTLIDEAGSRRMADHQTRKLVSFVVPVLNEEMNIQRLYDRVVSVMDVERARYDIEIIFTDNHSTDGTFDCIKRLAAHDLRVRGYRFSRNFGYQRSIHKGYALCRGDCAIQLDCDLQDPPEFVPSMLRLWEAGNDVVYGVRRSRRERWLLSTIRRVFYRLLNASSVDDLPPDAGDFRLIGRNIINALQAIWDPQIYLRGRIATMGFRQIGFPYDRHAREKGSTKFHFYSLLSLAIDAFLSHSIIPLRIATFTGILALITALLGIVGYIGAKVILGNEWPAGFTTIVVMLLLNLGFISLFLGVIGEYIARIYVHLKAPSDLTIEDTV